MQVNTPGRLITWLAYCLPSWRILLFCCLSGGLLCPFKGSSQTVTYDYASGTQGDTVLAYDDDGSSTNQLLSGEYDLIETNNGTFHQTTSTIDGLKISHTFVFYIDELKSDVDSVEFYYNGAGVNDYSGTSSGTSFYIYNYTDGAYQLQNDSLTSSEIVESWSINSPGSYIGGTNNNEIAFRTTSVNPTKDGWANVLSTDYASITINSSQSVDHYEIEHDGAGSTCAAETVTIKACANSDCSSLVTTSASLELLADGVSVANPTFTGSITLSYDNSAVETVTLSVSNESVSADNALVCGNTSGGSSCDQSFTNTACPSCSAVFPSAVGTSGNSGIAISGNATIDDNTNGVLATANLTVSGRGECLDGNNQACSQSGTGTEPLTLPTNTSTTDLTTTTTFTAGDHFFRGISLSGGESISFSGSGTARLYFNTSLSLASGSDFNALGTPDQLVIFVDGDINIASNDTYNAIIYATGQISISGSAVITGAIAAAGGISVSGSPIVSYSGSYITDADIGSSCLSSASASLDHYRLEYDGSALTCATETITLKACENNSCSILYTSPTTVTFQAAMTGPVVETTDTTFTGSTTITVAEPTETIVTLSLTATSPTASLKCYEGIALDNSCDYTTTDTGFLFTNETDGDQIIPTQLSNKPSNTGYNSKSLALQAVKLDTDTGACAPLFADGSDVAVELAYQCESPGSCSGNPVTIANNNNSLTLGDFASAYITSNLRFGADSKATIVVNYPEAGQIKLHARKSIELLPGETKVMSGNTNRFVVRPFGLKLDVNDAANSTAADEDGTVFRRAGEVFAVNATGVRWVSGEDANNDGVPDVLTALNDNATAANFSGEVLKLSHALVSPGGGINGVLSGATTTQAFTTSVAAVTDISWDEVGILTLNATLNDSDYLGVGDIQGSLANIGRFVPDHFTLGGSNIIAGCHVFTYMGQHFTVFMDLQAQNSANVITSNYDGLHAKSVISFVAKSIVAGDDADLTSRLTNDIPVWNAGSISIGTALNSEISRAVDGPFENTFIGFQIADGEADLAINLTNTLDLNAALADLCTPLTCDALKLHVNGAAFRYGRLTSQSSYGPVNLNMVVPVFTEVFNGNAFVLSSEDNCSAVAANEVAISGRLVSPFDSYDVYATGTSVDIGSTSIDTISDPATTTTVMSAVGGRFNLTLTAPLFNVGEAGLTAEAPITVNLDNYPWLQFDWNGDGTIDGDDTLPVKTVTFGQSRGNDRVIYWREKR
jgi:MSHA biogenesis protein MshQ